MRITARIPSVSREVRSGVKPAMEIAPAGRESSAAVQSAILPPSAIAEEVDLRRVDLLERVAAVIAARVSATILPSSDQCGWRR